MPGGELSGVRQGETTITRSSTFSVRSLTKTYGSVTAVDDVSLEIPGGSFLTLLGPSGSGKTTILMAIAGFVEPTRGDILRDRTEITKLPPDKRNFGMVFQGYALFPHMTVEENVWFPLRVRGASKAAAADRVKGALDMVQLGPLAGRLPTELSGGQQQRVALARALVFEPDLLLLDEPLSALDKKLRAELQWELKALHQKLGTTFIYVTHDQEEALSMSDEIVILRDGRIEQSGAPGTLYERPATRFVADFLGKSNFLAGEVAERGQDRFHYTIGEERLVQAGAPLPTAPNGRVLVALRPEKLLVFNEKPATQNVSPGRIEQFNYYGANYHFKVTTPALGDLIVTAPAWRCEVEPRIGSEIWVGWDPDAAVVIAESPEGHQKD